MANKNLTHRKIGGVKLINTGLRGVIITYETVEILDGVSYTSDDDKKSYRPAHRELKDLMKKLVTPLIELCGYPASDAIGAHQEIDFEVTGVKASTDSFLISGKLRCWEDKVIALNTPLIKEGDQYESFDDVMKIVDNLYKETELYLSGAKNITKEAIVEDWVRDVKKKSTFKLEDDLTGMDGKELEEMMKQMEKDCGFSVHMEGGKMVLGDSPEVIQDAKDADAVIASKERIEATDEEEMIIPVFMDTEVNLESGEGK